MQAIPIEQAKRKLAEAIEQLPSGDAVEAFGEVFVGVHPPADSREVVKQIVDYIHQGAEIEEVLDLWNVVFPENSNIYFDEETMKLCYDEEFEEMPLAE